MTNIRLSDVDFLVSTHSNTTGLERLLLSILNKYPGAKITIADSGAQLDRQYYKKLRLELSEAGMLNRMVIHHIAYKAPLGQAFNELIKVSTGKYRLLLTDEDIFTEDTDVEKMVRVMQSNKSIGVVGGTLDDDTPVIDGREMETEDGDTFGATKQINRFMMIFTDVKLSLRFDPKSEDFAMEFSNQAKARLPLRWYLLELN